MGQDDFLVLCLASGITPERIRTVFPRSPSEWSELVARAGREGLTPMLHSRLAALPAGLVVPPDVRDRLRRDYLLSAARGTLVYHGLASVLSCLRQSNLRVIVLKGAYLAETVYGNIALRPMTDVDLLLAESDVDRARDLLRDLGFVPCGHDDHHVALVDPRSQILLEIHWRLSSGSFPFRLESLPLWDRAVRARVAGVEVEVLSPEDLVLHLCLHAAYHHTFDRGIRYLLDVTEVVRHFGERIDWARCRDSARLSGLTRCLYLTLWCAHDALGCAVPETALEDLRPEHLDPDWREETLRRVLRPPRGDGRHVSSANLSRLWAPGSIRDKLEILGRSFFPSRGTLSRMYAVPADSARIYACYLRRWRDHFVRHRRSAWSLLLRREREIHRATRENELRGWLSGPS